MEIELDAPQLDMFMYNDRVAEGYPVLNIDSVSKVHIDVGLSDDQMEEPDFVEYYNNVWELVMACFNADHMYLSKVCMHLGGLDVMGWALLPNLLVNAPNLEFFEISEGFYNDEECYARFEENMHEVVTVCLSLHLKQFEIWEFGGEEDEVKFVEYLLKNARVLSKIKIYAKLPWEKIFCIWKRLLLFPKSSSLLMDGTSKMKERTHVDDDGVAFSRCCFWAPNTISTPSLRIGFSLVMRKCVTLVPNPQAQVFSDPNVAMDIRKKNLSMIIPHNFAWVNFFFSGFVAAKLPFPLTQRFIFMLQTRY
ncbi:hypothetical protein RJ639_043150 [Escallonia herrerae]|uniref:FBD domain-containing protein n=1 Tax=Escallonia herrerae TaxID=1293975 RepID=A0AA88WCN1_9ASTE|nr:hypothetical protein RJ639_043150 [Escallonia herrerae]